MPEEDGVPKTNWQAKDDECNRKNCPEGRVEVPEKRMPKTQHRVVKNVLEW